MGKAKKSKDTRSYRHNPLDQQILESNFAQASFRNKVRSKQLEDDKFVDNKLTNEILKQAVRQQQEDIEEETGLSYSNSASRSCLSSNDQPEIEDYAPPLSTESAEGDIISVSEDDKEALRKFLDGCSENCSAISEAIEGKLTEKRSEIDTLHSDIGSEFNNGLCDNKLQEKFQELVPILKNYRSGKLPKIFKAIPRYSNWEQILYLTEPDKWSAATMYEATRMFSSNLQDRMAQRFYNVFLFPRLRDDIAEGKLNAHIYAALKKALYKPAAFFKGIIIPLCQAEDGKVKEATIIGSVLAKCSIPVLHSSAALLTIAELEYSSVCSIFMRILLEKKYALPYRVINGVVDHFLRFMDDPSHKYLLWHQCLLTFVQIYKMDLSSEQKANLLNLLTVHNHEKVTPEIRKELEAKPDLSEMMQHTWKM